MILNNGFSEKLSTYGADPANWPLPWRLLLPLWLRDAGRRQRWQQIQAEETQFQALYREMPTLPVAADFRLRLEAVAQRPQVVAGAPRGLSLWRWGTTTALASVLLGFMLGMGGLLLPMGEVAGVDVDIVSNYEVSLWLAGEVE